jgi:hypothetical protein
MLLCAPPHGNCIIDMVVYPTLRVVVGNVQDKAATDQSSAAFSRPFSTVSVIGRRARAFWIPHILCPETPRLA